MFGNSNNKPPPAKKIANIDENQVNTNQQAIPVPYMAGRQRVALIWAAPVYKPVTQRVTTTVGKGEEQTTGYIYFGDVFGIICMAGRVRLAKLFRHILESEIAWENEAGLVLSSTATAVTITDRGQTWLYRGDPDQPLDPHVLTPIGPPPGNEDFDPRDPTTWPGGGDYSGEHPDP